MKQPKLCPECERPLKIDPEYSVLSPAGLVAANPRAKCSCGWTGEFKYGLTEPRIPNPKPAMPYVSIDIETTGLNPETCQILEIGAVFDDWTLSIKDLPTFHCYVVHKQIVGQPYGLALNADTLRKLANPPPGDSRRFTPGVGEKQCDPNEVYLRPEMVAGDMAAWLNTLGWPLDKSLNVAGKNFASFDRQFLKRLPEFEHKVHLSHRTLDPAMLYWLPTDDKLPDSKTCYERAGMNPTVAHTALEDAISVVQLLRTGVKRLRTY
jgi:oligoribonuclease (3'-5' exoribonuclease)